MRKHRCAGDGNTRRQTSTLIALVGAVVTIWLVLGAIASPALATETSTQTMYRLYNPNSGEHFYTASTHERDYLDNIGWNYEGEAWDAPMESSVPVYRLYNPYAGDHHYTASAYERDCLDRIGWNYEGIGWYSDDAEGTPIYRLYNPYAQTATHHYTASAYERNHLDSIGWNEEGIGWYGVKPNAASNESTEVHEHEWQPIYETMPMVRCNGLPSIVDGENSKPHVPCGEVFFGMDAFTLHNDYEHDGQASYTNYDKQILTGYRCSCGATKSADIPNNHTHAWEATTRPYSMWLCTFPGCGEEQTSYEAWLAHVKSKHSGIDSYKPVEIKHTELTGYRCYCGATRAVSQ